MPPSIPGVDVFCDVLVVGAGPSGYMAALTLARYGVDLRIIDKRAMRIQVGHSSGLFCLIVQKTHPDANSRAAATDAGDPANSRPT